VDLGDLYEPALDAHVAEANAFNEQLASMLRGAATDLTTPEGLARARDLDAIGGGVYRTVTSPRAEVRHERDAQGREIELRVITPADATPTSVYLDIHGGGFFMGSPAMNDTANQSLADAAACVTVSVRYRLAPEHPYPAGPDDCEAAACWVLDHMAQEWGTDRIAIGGGSAGGGLVAVTLLRLRDRHDAAGAFCAANMLFGVYDLSGTPSQIRLGQVGFRDLYLPRTPPGERKVADISPLYGELHGMPPALFTVGTLDYLYDDSLFMAARWRAAGNESHLAIYPASPHGFTSFPTAMARAARARITEFLASRLRA
jgi:acetyl esterase/lipase